MEVGIGNIGNISTFSNSENALLNPAASFDKLYICFPSAEGPGGRCRAEANDVAGRVQAGAPKRINHGKTGARLPLLPATDMKG